ncbi:reprolysin-like metallopeptidase [Streptomyces olivochromogenes]|uniref:reprolysin-like metallopeptidase n=1 Tax=Streptomyces olivochromogenes TaxID=1963 RepID=UPI001F44C2B8|nr:M12 family metallo-peptidase [Streptomyces olivochromogenes]MCF3134605.1 hypothetical protein [Streptomyces olivochromogenes]
MNRPTERLSSLMRHSSIAACAAASALLTTVPLALTSPAASAATGGGNEPWVVRSAVLRADAKEFAGLCGEQKEGTPETRTFRLFKDGPTITAERDFLRQDPDGTVYWDGHDPKSPEDTVSLSIIGLCNGGPITLDGVIEIGFKDYLFTPLPKQPGKYCLEEIDTLKLPPSGHGDDTVTEPTPSRSGRPKPKAADISNPVAIDMVVPYTPAALRELGGLNEVKARIRYGESQLNKALAASHVPASVHVVNSYETEESGVPDEDAPTMRAKLKDPNDQEIGATAHAKREEFGADLVALLASIPIQNSSGQADLPLPPSTDTADEAYSVTSVLSVKEWDNLAHEIGHNFGLQHDRQTIIGNGGTPQPGATNFGWVTADKLHHTLMAYSSACAPENCKVVNQYSNTENTINGQALGDANNNNAAAARISTPIVSGYRASKVVDRHTLGLSTSPANGGTITISEFGPYDPGTQVTVSAHPAAGFQFDGWTVDGQQKNVTTDYQLTINANRNIVARFSKTL